LRGKVVDIVGNAIIFYDSSAIAAMADGAVTKIARPRTSLAEGLEKDKIERVELVKGILNEHAIHIVSTRASMVLEVPHELHVADPPGFWLIEILTRIPGAAIAANHADGKNEYLSRCELKLRQILVGRFVTISFLDDGSAVWLGGGAPGGDPVGIDSLKEVVGDYIRERLKLDEYPILMVDRDWPKLIKYAWWILTEALKHNLFLQTSNQCIIFVRETEYGSLDKTVVSSPQLAAGLLGRYISFCKCTLKGKLRPCEPPARICDDLVHFAAKNTLRELDHIVETPTLRADGSLLITPGYDEKSKQWYYQKGNVQFTDIPTLLTDVEAGYARAAISELWKDFNFKDPEVGLAVVWGMLFEPLLLPMIEGPRPAYIFTAPALNGQGSGKSLIPKTIVALHTGELCGTQGPQMFKSEEETRKALFTALLDNNRFFVVDNLRGKLASSELEAFLTSPARTQRILGRSESSHRKNNLIMALTLNGAQWNTDMARRSLVCELNKPKKTQFGDNLEHRVLRQRHQLLSQLLRLTQLWVAAGCPPPVSGWELPSFESWSRIIGGIVEFTLPECQGALLRANQVAQGSDTNTNDYRALYHIWLERYGDAEIDNATILELTKTAEVFPYLHDLNKESAAIRLGKGPLADALNTVLFGYRMEKRVVNGKARYKLSAIEPEQVHEPEPEPEPEPEGQYELELEADFSLEYADESS